MPRKARRLAERSALSSKVKVERLTVLHGLVDVETRIKGMKGILEVLLESRWIMIVTDDKSAPIRRCSGTLEQVWVMEADFCNVRDILKFDRLLVTSEAIPVVESWLALPEDKREPSSWRQAREAQES